MGSVSVPNNINFPSVISFWNATLKPYNTNDSEKDQFKKQGLFTSCGLTKQATRVWFISPKLRCTYFHCSQVLKASIIAKTVNGAISVDLCLQRSPPKRTNGSGFGVEKPAVFSLVRLQYLHLLHLLL